MTTSTANFTAANRTFFDDLAAKYDIKPWQQKMSLQITNHIQQNLDLIGIPKHPNPITLLDYACGTGLISRALGPSVTIIEALDLSPKMIERYNSFAATSDILSVRKASAREGDLLADRDASSELNQPKFYDFDIAAVGSALHHFDDPAKAITRLAQRLKVGGVLLIVDFVEEEEHGQPPTGADHTIRKHGFSKFEMKAMMEECGLRDFRWSEMAERVEMLLHEDRPISKRFFLARAAKV